MAFLQGTTTSTGTTTGTVKANVASRYGFTRAATTTSFMEKSALEKSALEKASEESANDQDDLIAVDLNLFEEEGEDYEMEPSKDDLLKYTMTVNWMEKDRGDF